MAKITRRDVLAGASALVGGGPTFGCAGDEPAHPPPDTGVTVPTGRTVVYVYVDQLRWDALGATGNPVADTPNLDAFAAEAASFSRCMTNAPSCRAARATMMTGLHVFGHQVWDNFVEPSAALQSHVRRIRDEAGYFAMVIGKTHLHDGFGHFDDFKQRLAAWGFSDAVELPDPQAWRMQSAHSDWLTATTPPGEVDKYQRWQAYIQAYTWDSPPPDAPPTSLGTEDHLDRFCGRAAADFVGAWPDDQPLYLQVCFPGPHKPFDPTSAELARIDANDPAMPQAILALPAEPVAPLVQEVLLDKSEDWTEASVRRLRQHYYAKVSLVDDAIGEVFAALKARGLYDDAWIIVHSDHGELLGDHQLTGKRLGYEGSIRVPLLIRPPGGIAGWTDDGQVDQMDVTATLLALCGLDPTGFGDRDLSRRVVEGPAGAQAHASKPVMYENLGMVGVRDERYKLGWDLQSGRPVELYDLQEDPEERVNRVLDPAVREPLDGLVATLRSMRPLPVDSWPG
jgi:arylsulfatase